MTFKDYYAVLGVKKDAPGEEIKRAYRRLARQHHPDLQAEKGKAQAEARFKEINEAYEVLSDPEKRSKYDQLGPDWESARQAEPSPSRRGPGRRPAGAEQFSGFSDFFEELFGGGGGGRGFGVREASGAAADRGQDVEAEMPLSLEDALAGGRKSISIQVPVICPNCAGTGGAGRGFCASCGGLGETRRNKSIEVRLPRHIQDGAKLRLRGQGGPAVGGKEPGDLFLRIRLLPHPGFKVSGDDLETAVTVMPWTAALGGEATVSTLEGPLRIRIPPGTRAGRPLRVPGKGLGKGGGERGDLYAVVRIDNPERIDSRLERLYRQMGESGA